MTQPDGADPNGALNPTKPGAFGEFQSLTEADIFDKQKAPIVGTGGSARKAQLDLAAADGNVIPSGTGLWQTFTRNADATFPRIMLEPQLDSSTGFDGSSGGSHSHSMSANRPPDYRPAGNGANLIELGFIECTKDRRYERVTFGTGNSVTLLGITAMYVCAYLMSPSTGELALMAATGNITTSVGDTNTEYTFDLPAPIDALKAEVWAVGVLQVTSVTQTCKSILAKRVWAMNAPSGFRPAALYATAGPYVSPPATIAYSSLTFGTARVPYYALS
ncbi:hypothetical protein F5X71_00455 [Nocardia brasiliensis]|uniref:Uncharacterized protein n=1 Tax=Nocardia brasiliensis TaxID=37326 RepID=A0A6G9XJC8_NOCBR|nr:hypothetical protein [Nocardia brasiliensis]QIS01003.1 hypothetical protein F5X71_00455 [Nocardia brasiliensis]